MTALKEVRNSNPTQRPDVIPGLALIFALVLTALVTMFVAVITVG
jgi:hypothetical protein